MAQSEIVVHIARPDHQENQLVQLWHIGPRRTLRACVATVWGVPQILRSHGALPVMVVVRHSSLIVGFFDCHRVTHNDPLQEKWAEEDAMEAAELIYADALPA